jgi:hypothetical protein
MHRLASSESTALCVCMWQVKRGSANGHSTPGLLCSVSRPPVILESEIKLLPVLVQTPHCVPLPTDDGYIKVIPRLERTMGSSPTLLSPSRGLRWPWEMFGADQSMLDRPSFAP